MVKKSTYEGRNKEKQKYEEDKTSQQVFVNHEARS